MSAQLIVFLCTVLLCLEVEAVTIEGWIFADNWFEFYFNGVKIVTDPIVFQPKNAVKVKFDAPSSGLYSFAFYAKDYADDVTGLEYEDTCLGDGGIRISLSDGTVSNANWKCFVEMEGPINPIQCGLNDGDCTPTGTQCRVQYNTVPSCWNETICDTTSDQWQIASEYADELIGFGKLKNGQIMDCGEDIECSLAREVDWFEYGLSTFIWTSDLLYDNRIMCRYQYWVGPRTTAAPTSVPTISPTLPTSSTPPRALISRTERGSSAPTTTVPTSADASPTGNPAQLITVNPTISPITRETAPYIYSDGDSLLDNAWMCVVIGFMSLLTIAGACAIYRTLKIYVRKPTVKTIIKSGKVYGEACNEDSLP
eukprot:248822_1